MNDYQIETVTSKDWEMIEIKISRQERGGYISVIAKFDYEARNIYYMTLANVTLSGCYSPTETREVMEWWGLADTTLEILERTITSRSAFIRQWSARIVGRLVVIEEVISNDPH